MRTTKSCIAVNELIKFEQMSSQESCTSRTLIAVFGAPGLAILKMGEERFRQSGQLKIPSRSYTCTITEIMQLQV